MKYAVIILAASLTLARAAAAQSTSPAPNKVDTVLTDWQLFDGLNLDYPGLTDVKQAIQAGEVSAARHALATYFRTQHEFYNQIEPFHPDLSARDQMPGSVRSLLEHSGIYDQKYWLANGQLDLRSVPIKFLPRFYYWDGLAKTYRQTHDERLAQAWIVQLHSFVAQFPPIDDMFWRTMHIGIRMRSAYPAAFRSFLNSPSFNDDELILFLKSTLEQTLYLRANHKRASNWLTFEMAGLYTSGVMYPQFKAAREWRTHAVATSLADLDNGWLPDGMGIELTPGYGQFFSNYFTIIDVARKAGCADEDGVARIVPKTQRLYELYLNIMAPDRQTPATNDNAAVDVPAMMAKALKYFPQRQDFRWAASDAREGATPPYTSMLFPFGGFAALRNGWGRGDNMLYFDFGPIGYMHAHQDKLNVILWAHGRQILFDSGRSNYDEFPRYQHYAMDTYSHNTVLVDDRPQRRAPGRPNPDQTPYKQLTDFQSELTPQYDYVAGVYDGKYGKPHSDPDAYEKGSDFADDNVEPATHHRRVIFYKPDVFVIADTLIARDQQSHTYDTRWQLDSTEVTLASDGQTAFTADADQPNLEVIPLLTAGLTVKRTTAQKEPHLLGWKFWSKPLPATTLQHLKSGPDTVQFATLLLPLKPGQTSLVQSAKAAGPSSFEFTLRDGRHFRLEIPPDPAKKITLTPMTP